MGASKKYFSIALIALGLGIVVYFLVAITFPADCEFDITGQVGEIPEPKDHMTSEEFTAYRNSLKEREKLIDELIRSGELECT